MKHIAVVHPQGYHEHEYYHLGCQICDGGLFLCKVCGGLEGSLATDCPGEQITIEQQDAIYAGKLDFVEGRGWIKK